MDLGRDRLIHEEKRLALRANALPGTLACRRCDAPIAPGSGPLALTDTLACPFCDEVGPVRDFLSLATPGRPARVLVRVSLPLARH